ncbi:class I SAM-dependent methyltransferase [Arvimicrobium flavum]|uniref:class I SAM-dependent methyltransferase n=1 Tax=Arvimicrobium flavum TaxID=3393320 RepID=UPI00237B9389|nr:class I SAM-dependent methyltransferase [Mesorhizobium shangrilense]
MAEPFDEYSSSYGETVAESIRFSGLGHDFFLKAKANLLRRLIHERGLRRQGRSLNLLDIGCGVGSLHRHLEGMVDSLNGCDVSEQSIDRAQRDHPENVYTLCTSSRLPYANSTFDLALASCVLHHVPPAAWPAFLDETRRVLRLGGVACIIEHNPFNPLTRLAVFRCPFDKGAVLLTARKAKALARGAGFKELRVEHFLLLPTAGYLAQRVEQKLSAFPLGAQYACSGRA